MWRNITLKIRLVAILTSLVLLTAAGGGVMIWYTYRIESLLTVVTKRHFASYQAAVSLETALAKEKGLVSYYALDGNPDWLGQLQGYQKDFKLRLAEVYRLSEGNSEQLATLSQIENEYNRYIARKDQVIDFYQSGRHTDGLALHETVRGSFFTILDLCETFKSHHADKVAQARRQIQLQAKTLRLMAAGAMIAGFLMASGLMLLLFRQILEPVHRLAVEANRKRKGLGKESDISVLHHGIKDLLQDVDSTRMALEKSRETLLQSEKLALVGKLAAGMAHSIRNPFTSVKMRLFSLGRTLELTDTQQDDLAVISDEIRHIDTIVQNFLEFSRPPKLQFQHISPSLVVDQVLQLLSHRLKSYDVGVAVIRSALLPEIEADPEQLKEVLVNLIVNACEAMEQSGNIEIVESNGNKVVSIEVSDNGPGIPEALQEKIFQPFFTTKEDGTGLGLSIATRIIEEHRGRLSVSSDENRGSTFTIILPFPEARS
jgi:signal transduction histidine kinase